MVAVKNHDNAVNNPMAHLRFAVTVEQVPGRALVVEPFGVLDCCPQSDGAAALIIVAARTSPTSYTDHPVWVRGVGLGIDRVMHQHKADLATFAATKKAAQAGLRDGRHRSRRPRRRRGARLLQRGRADGLRGPRLLRARWGAEDDRVRRDPRRRAGSRSTRRRVEGQGPPAGSDRCRPVRRAVRAAARPRRPTRSTARSWALAHNVGGPTAVSAVTILEAAGG